MGRGTRDFVIISNLGCSYHRVKHLKEMRHLKPDEWVGRYPASKDEIMDRKGN